MWCAGCSADAAEHGAGKRYLIQHSYAGSGKSNQSIAWLATNSSALSGRCDEQFESAFESIIVVTDRRILDKQIRDDTIKQYAPGWELGGLSVMPSIRVI